MKWVDAPIWIKLGRNIKSCRKWKGLSVETVVSRSKIDLKRYKRIERAVVPDITYDEVFRLAKAMGTDEENISYH